MQQPPTYKVEELQEILQRAIARQAYEGEFSREQLVEIATELGIDRQSLLAAERDWLAHQMAIQKHDEFNIYRRGQLKQKGVKILIVNTFLALIDLFSSSTSTLSWSLYVLLGSGLLVSLEAWKTFQTEGEEYEKEFQSWQFQRELKTSLGNLWDKLQRLLQS